MKILSNKKWKEYEDMVAKLQSDYNDLLDKQIYMQLEYKYMQEQKVLAEEQVKYLQEETSKLKGEK